MASPVADPELEELLASAEAAVGALVDHGAEPADVLDAYAVVRRVEALARRVAAVQTGVVSTIARRRLHVGDGHRSARALVGHAARLSPADAGRRARSARALDDLPSVAAAFAAGRVGSSQVDRIARVHANARVRPKLVEIDAHLATAAERLSYEELDRHLGEWERLADEDGAGDRAERCHRRRDFSIRQNLDGSWRFEGGCGSIQGAVTADVLDAYVRAEFEADWAEARSRLGDEATAADLGRTDAQRRMDAFERICRDAADAVRAGTGHSLVTNVVVDQLTAERYTRRAAGDDPGPDPRLGDYWADLAATEAEDGGAGTDPRVGPRCSTLAGHRIDPAEAAAAMLVGQLRRVVLGADSVVIDLGRRSRLFTGAAHLAVLLHAERCYWPGCHVPVTRCQADHLEPWGAGGRTDPGNGAPACGMHNRFRNHGFTVERAEDGALVVCRPDGSRVSG
jgi:hypothetical protein